MIISPHGPVGGNLTSYTNKWRQVVLTDISDRCTHGHIPLKVEDLVITVIQVVGSSNPRRDTWNRTQVAMSYS